MSQAGHRLATVVQCSVTLSRRKSCTRKWAGCRCQAWSDT